MSTPVSYAVVDSSSNAVVNVIDWDGVAQWAPPSGTYLVGPSDISSGSIIFPGSWDPVNKVFSPPVKSS